jgi:hypothetical protein
MHPIIEWDRKRALEAFSHLRWQPCSQLPYSAATIIGSNNFPLEYIILPILIWTAFRFGQRGRYLSLIISLGNLGDAERLWSLCDEFTECVACLAAIIHGSHRGDEHCNGG